MKIPDEQKAEIFDGMLAMLDPEATEQVEVIKEIEGRNLIYQGIFKDTHGRPILPGIKYLYSITATEKINHKQKMGHIIEGAANQAEITEKLGEYLAKYAKDPAAVRTSIPAIYSAANVKKSDN
jgi:hypothetical protein